jgi:O-antigen ligase
MPPIVATAIFACIIAGLFWLDRDRKEHTSWALWIPVTWFAIVCSRPVSLWLNPYASLDSADQVMDGSPLDRLVFSLLLVVAFPILAQRWAYVRALLSENGAILLFFFVGAMSLLWSDYPGVALKRLVKAFGDFLMVLIILTERNRLCAIKRLLNRLGYLLIPLSVLLTKYYPHIGMAYNEWTGTPFYTGVTMNKNTLGVICLCLGLGAIWRLIDLYKNKGNGRIRRMAANGLLLAMVLRLFQLMDSMTSLSCFLMASMLLWVASFRAVVRRPILVHLMIAVMLAGSFSVLFLNVSPGTLQAIGRNPTLTERTYLWKQLLDHVDNPWVGTGFESFWLGSRLDEIWRLNPWLPNQAHNGYLEIYLNLGWLGVVLLLAVILAGYWTVQYAWRHADQAGNLRLSLFFVGLVYNFTEAAFFRMQSAAWLFFMLAVVQVPGIVTGVTKARTKAARQPVDPVVWQPANVGLR